MKLSLGTVFFKPTNEDIKSFIKLSLNFTNSICYLNSEISKNQINSLIKNQICILGSSHNDGLSVAYNKILSRALEIKSEFILLTDQDSRFQDNILNDFINNICLKEKIDPKVAIFSMTPKDNVNVSMEEILRYRENKFSSKKFSINSGSFLRVKAWNQIGGYDEKLFIDKVDTDFCQTLVKNKWKILQSEIHQFKHSIGQQKRFLLGIIKYNSQNEFRHYHSMLSRIYILKKYIKNNPSNNLILFLKNLKFFLQVLKHIMLILLFEEEKINKLNNIFKPFFYKNF